MKKTLILFLAFLLFLTPAAAEEENTEQSGSSAAGGNWYADADGVPVRLCLNEDGTFELSIPGDVSEGEWETEDGCVLLDGAAEFPLELIGGALIQEDAGLVFTREDPGTYAPEEPVPDAEAGWFGGYWASVYADMSGTPVPASSVGDDTDLWIDGTLAALGGRRFGDIFWNFTFENGKMTAALDDGRTVDIAFQRDGILRMTVAGQGEETVLYLAPAWSEALDGAAED